MTRRSLLQLFLLSALAVSLVANVFLLGFVARTADQLPVASSITENLAQAYPAEVRAEFRNLLRENRPRTRAGIQELRQARQALTTALHAEQLDDTEVERAMQNVRQATNDLQRLLQEFLVEAVRLSRGAE